jgi:hypothetical protein
MSSRIFGASGFTLFRAVTLQGRDTTGVTFHADRG